MYLRREEHLIFHGCVPVDEQGDFLPMLIDGKPYAGRALFTAIEGVVYRVIETRKREDLDLFWYLWSGPQSPLFGKDRITTLESSLIADPRAHQETKNPYFRLIHESWFCEKILAEFGVDPAQGLIVNGHVPVASRKRRVSSEKEREGDHDRWRFFREPRGSWIHFGVGAAPDVSGSPLPF